MVSVLQFAEGLTDRQAADAVRGRIDVKYALGLELDDPGFDFSVLSENAARNILHLYRIGHVIVEVPAAGRRGRRAGKTVKPVAAR